MYQRISKNFNKLTHTKYEPVPPSLMWILADYIGDFRQNNLQLNFRLWDLVMNNFSPLWQSKFVRDISVFHMIVFSVKYQNFYTFYSPLKNATYFTRFLLHMLVYNLFLQNVFLSLSKIYITWSRKWSLADNNFSIGDSLKYNMYQMEAGTTNK